jgi:hypothetical protein
LPDATPVTVPVEEPIVASEALLLLQVPPDEPSLNVVVAPAQTIPVPVIDDGSGLTVTAAVL